jgi:hypothetical protein
LDEIIVATIDSEISPIHYCDKGKPSTSKDYTHQLSAIKINSFDESHNSLSTFQKQSSNPQSLDPSSANKKRSEYSMRGIKLDSSQDSAFGSMTDGEISRASSFKLSSFQSVSSPIDEGVEDILDEKHSFVVEGSLKYIDSNSSSPCPDNFTQSLNDLNVPGLCLNSLRNTNSNIKETCIFLDPPKLIVNDSNYIYTASPIMAGGGGEGPTFFRKCATSEAFSQKCRVSSFSDIEVNSSHLKNQVSKKPFRSFEEEQRIESAFTPLHHYNVNSNDLFEEKQKCMTGKERRDSFSKCNKNNSKNGDVKTSERNASKISIESDDDDDETSVENSSASMTVSGEMSSTQSSHWRSSERLLFSLAKFKYNATIESVALSGSSSSRNKNSSSSNDDTITSTTNDECNSEEECSSLSESLLKTPTTESLSIEDVRKFVKTFELENASVSVSGSSSEAAPLLGIEMHSMSSTEY